MVSWIEWIFFLVIYSNASQLTYSLIGPTAIARKVLWIRSVLLSGSFIGIGSLVFSGTQHGVRDPYGVMTVLDFLKKIFLPPKIGKILQASGSLHVYENLIFLLNLVYNGSLY